jgi:hypothetical protein
MPAPILNDDSTALFEETYWRLERALEEFFLKDDTTQAYLPGGQTPISWEELQQIITGHHTNGTIVNGYSNRLIPPIVGGTGLGSGIGVAIILVDGVGSLGVTFHGIHDF